MLALGTVQVIDRKTGNTKEMMHGFQAPHDAVRLADGTLLVHELGTQSLVRVSGEHGADRTPILGGLAGPVGLVAVSNDAVYLSEAFSGQVLKLGSNGEKTAIADDLRMPVSR
jgi:hypothetical protein